MNDKNTTDFGGYLAVALKNVQAHDEYFEAKKSEPSLHVLTQATYWYSRTRSEEVLRKILKTICYYRRQSVGISSA